MSSYTTTYRHKKTGGLYGVDCIDDYFGPRNYGYIVHGTDEVLSEASLNFLYEPVEDSRIKYNVRVKGDNGIIYDSVEAWQRAEGKPMRSLTEIYAVDEHAIYYLYCDMHRALLEHENKCCIKCGDAQIQLVDPGIFTGIAKYSCRKCPAKWDWPHNRKYPKKKV